MTSVPAGVPRAADDSGTAHPAVRLDQFATVEKGAGRG